MKQKKEIKERWIVAQLMLLKANSVCDNERFIIAAMYLVIMIIMILTIINNLNRDTTFLVTKMVVAFGKVSAFNPTQDEWPYYIERLGHVFTAKGITTEPKK